MWRGSKKLLLKINWDHMVPHSYSQDNSTKNIVAACHVCNGVKSDLMFQTVEEAQTYVETKWQEKGYRFTPPEIVPAVFEEVRAGT